MKKIILFCLILSFVSASSVYGEPSKTIYYLMDDCVSMLDWGLFKLQTDVDNFINYSSKTYKKSKKEKGKSFYKNYLSDYHTNVSYNWDDNRIYIKINIFTGNKDLKMSEKKYACKKIIEGVRGHYGAEIKDDEYISHIHHFFKHTNYENTDMPDNFTNEITNIVKIKVSISYSKNVWENAKIKDKKLISISSLKDGEIYFKENKSINNKAQPKKIGDLPEKKKE